ncbi:transglutaminase-like putative cysteine protease [Agromyces flavus]|uniref:Transglutaminase-like putative cysteine protease n=1 Tax=Agromyces flavus TaxID=589382 RepID=A0A1H1PPK4_9MICO|nr:transglutaminase-like domain-containing protein [Agromyces flavus]MCP2367882.1 transglutaminase-like putative cysteine protease [Agromyces flavus]GGI47343.1 cysteine protease [Agromyces flavus]SDS13251.1 Transglutaminase-like superfamily protein [Agromyces flavus]
MTRIPRTALADLGVLSLLSLLAIAGLETSFGGLDFLLAAVAGLVVGTLAAVLGTLWRLNVLTTVLLGIALYFLVGTPFVMPDAALFVVLPSLTSLAGLAIGAVHGWADILTISAPVEAPAYVAAVPYAAATVVSLVGGMLVLRWLSVRRSPLRGAVLLIGPVVLFLSGILLGTDESFLAAIRGVAFAAVALTWIAWRRGAQVETAGDGATRLRRRKLTGSAAVVAGAVIVGAVAGLALAPIAPQRFVLRDEVVPPFDPLQFASPLAGFREYTKDLAEEPLFTVAGLEPGDTVRLAGMDSYTGRLWNVAGPEQAATDGGYAIVGTTLPAPELADLGSSRSVEVEVLAYDDVWLPTVGYGSELELLDADAAERAGDLRYNAAAGTAVLTSGVAEGARYRLESRIQREPDDEDLADVPVAQLTLPIVENLPDVVAAKADEYAGEAASPIEQLRAIERGLKTNGFLSHGLASDAVPSRAGHGADRLIELFTRTQMVGDAEQYAAAMALMARHLGYPSRVVMGYAPEVADGAGEVEVLGSDVTAWVEVPFEGVGWVSFRPTPDNVDVPQEQTPKPKSEPQPQVRQPPRAEQAEDELLTTVEIDDTDDDDRDRPFQLPAWAWAIILSVSIPAAIVLLPMLAVALAKRRRRAIRHRGTGDRQAAGAWEELVDRYAELGFEPPERSSRLQTARALERQLDEQGLGEVRTGEDGVRLSTLAATVDRDVFGAGDLAPASVDRRWSEADAAAAAVAAAAGRLRRFVSRYRMRRRGRGG